MSFVFRPTENLYPDTAYIENRPLDVPYEFRLADGNVLGPISVRDFVATGYPDESITDVLYHTESGLNLIWKKIISWNVDEFTNIALSWILFIDSKQDANAVKKFIRDAEDLDISIFDFVSGWFSNTNISVQMAHEDFGQTGFVEITISGIDDKSCRAIVSFSYEEGDTFSVYLYDQRDKKTEFSWKTDLVSSLWYYFMPL